MSLTIGELVGFIRLDASGVNTGATLAEARAQAAARAIRAAAERVERERFAARLDLEIGDAERNIRRVEEKLTELRSRPTSAEVDAEIGQAELELARLQHQLAQLQGQRVRVRAEIDDAGSAARTRAQMAQLGSEALGTASKVLAIGGGIPVILGLAAALASAAAAAALLPALLGAAAAGIGGLVVGFGGVGDALTALGQKDQASAGASSGAGAAREAALERVRAATEALADAQAQAARTEITTGWQLADAARAVADAVARADDVAIQGARQVASARQAAADAVAQAAARMASAESTLARAQRSSRDAQEALTRAREDAKERIEDLTLALSGAALDEQSAQLRLIRAQQELTRASRKNKNGLDYQEAALGVRQAEQALAEAKDRTEDLAKESAKANAAGVDGADNVVQAQRRVDDANESVLDAEKALTQARIDGDRAVAESKARLQQAVEDEAKANAQAAADIARAREEQSRTEQQVAWAREDAAKRVADAERDLAKAIADSGKSAGGGAGGVDKYAQALAKLHPNARAVVQELARLKPQWEAIQKDVQGRLFAGVAEEIRGLAFQYLPILHATLGTVADGYNRAFLAASQWAQQSGVVTELRGAWARVSDAVAIFSQSLQPILSILKDLFVVGSEFLPGMAQGWLDGATAAATFFSEAAKSGELKTWIQNALQVLGDLWQILVNIGGIVGAVFGAADESGRTFLGTLVDITGSVRSFVEMLADSGVLGAFFAVMGDAAPYMLAAAAALKIISVALGAYNTILAVVRIGQAIASAQWVTWAAGLIAQCARAIASLVVTAATYVAQWVIMAAGAIARAAIMAASWLIAMGPVGWVIAIIVGLVALIIANWDTIVQWTSEAWSAVSQWVTDKVNEFVTWVNQKIDEFVSWITQQWQTLNAANDQFWQMISDGITSVVDFFTQYVPQKVMEFVAFLLRGWDNLVSMTKQAWDNFMRTIADTVNTVLTFVRNIPGNIVNALGNLGTLLVNAGRDIITGLWNGIQSMGAWLRDSILGFVRSFVPGPVLQFLGIASPSKLFADIGRWIPAGLGGGIIANAAAATDASRELAARTATAAVEGTRGALRGTTLDLSSAAVRGGDGATLPTDPRDPRFGGGDQGPRFLMPVTINNPVAERSSDAIGRAGSVLAAVGPWGDE